VTNAGEELGYDFKKDTNFKISSYSIVPPWSLAKNLRLILG
jgi:hypothetical protein